MKKKRTVIASFNISHPALGIVEINEIEGLSTEGLLVVAWGRTFIDVAADLSAARRKAVCLDLMEKRVEVLTDEWPEFLD